MPEKPLFGYKMHLATDQDSGLVRRAFLTPANVSDKTPFLALVQGDERAVGACPRAGSRPDPGADRGYESRWYRERLAEQGIADGVMGCDFQRRRLTPEEHARNRAIAPLRAPVERTFAILKRWYGYCRVRYAACCATPSSCSCSPSP